MKLSDIDIERLKDVLIEYGVIEYETKTPIKEILRTATDFKVDLAQMTKVNLNTREQDYCSIRFTISWNSPEGKKEHFWVVPMEDYKKTHKRKIIFEKFNSSTFWKHWRKIMDR